MPYMVRSKYPKFRVIRTDVIRLAMERITEPTSCTKAFKRTPSFQFQSTDAITEW